MHWQNKKSLALQESAQPTESVLNKFGDLKFAMIFKEQKIDLDMLNPNQRLATPFGAEYACVSSTQLSRSYFNLDMGYKITVKKWNQRSKIISYSENLSSLSL
jgi:hypothetical protein